MISAMTDPIRAPAPLDDVLCPVPVSDGGEVDNRLQVCRVPEGRLRIPRPLRTAATKRIVGLDRFGRHLGPGGQAHVVPQAGHQLGHVVGVGDLDAAGFAIDAQAQVVEMAGGQVLN